MDRTIIINEGQYGMLTEGFVNLEYHFTTLQNLLSMCREDMIALSPMVNSNSNNSDRKRKFFLSLTRIRDGRVGYSMNGNVRITLDGRKLRDSFKGQSFNYWGGNVFDNKHTYYRRMDDAGDEAARRKSAEVEFGRSGKGLDFNEFYKRNFNPKMQQHSGNESEDRLLSRNSVIDDAHRYVLSVDVLLETYDDTEKYYAMQVYRYKDRYNIRFFDSKEEFNRPNGKDVNDKIQELYVNGEVTRQASWDTPGRVDCSIGDILALMSLTWNEKDVPLKIKEMLSKYGLQKYQKNMSSYINRCKNTYSVTMALDRLYNFGQRIHSRDEAYAMQMLTDFILSIGADNMRGAARILKNRLADESSRKYGMYPSTRIDVSVKIPLYVDKGNYIVFKDPRTTRFNDVVRWDADRINGEADWVASTVNYDRDVYHTTSKNERSIFMYVRKLISKGSVYDVMSALQKMGIWDEFAESNNIRIQREELDYYDAVRYNTPGGAKEDDWNTRSRASENEIEGWYPKLNHN